MQKNKTIIFAIVGGAVLVVVLVLYGLLSSGSSSDPRLSLQAEIDFWGVFDEEVAYRAAINDFNSIYPEVEINYRRFNSVEDYERTLLDALAAGEGPDIFMVRNNDLKRKKNKINPIPSNRYSLIEMNQQFPDIVGDNFYEDDNFYALPLSIDTLSLIYNKDLFAQNQIVFPPETWSELTNQSSKITEFDEQGNITTFGAALGGSNVHRAKDILSLIMMQSGSEMTDEDYDSIMFDSSFRFNPLDFYTKFARETSSNYSWSNNAGNSITEFQEGNVGMMLGYHSDLSQIKDQRPLLSVDVAEAPQFQDRENVMSYANYWGYTVSRQAEYPAVAWDFIINTTTNPSNAREYLNVTEKPPALSRLVQEYLNDPEMNVYAGQILTAKSWPEPNPERVSQVFANMIDRALSEEYSPSEALNRARSEIVNMMESI